jgi:phenylalanyl-tRNA synthetase beta chain
MKITLNWLRKHLDFEQDVGEKLLLQLENALMLQGAELDDISLINPLFIGEILTIRAIDGLEVRICEVRLPKTPFSEEKTIQIFSKSPNIYEKMRVIVAPEGTRLPAGQLIGQRTAKGVVSYGLMLGEELGFMPDFVVKDSARGIYDCGNKELGLWRYDDVLLNISAPANRWDLKSARYLAHNLGFGKIKPLPQGSYSKNKTPLALNNSTDLACKVALVKNFKIQEEISVFMERIGKKSQSKLQTLNDFIALDVGHPINIMDYQSIVGSLSIIPREKKGFRLVDEEKDLSLMGEKTLVGFKEGTKDILLEVAYFEPEHITSSRGASAPYFLAGIDRKQDVLGYLAHLLKDSGEFFQPLGKEPKQKERILGVSLARYEQMTGKTMNIHVMKNILNSYKGFNAEVVEVVQAGCVQGSCNAKYDYKSLRVNIPSWRQDIKIEANLVNEVNRSLYHREITNTEKNRYNFSPYQLTKNNLRNLLVSLGFDEVFTYPFLAEPDGPGAPEIENPMREDSRYLRTKLHSTLLPAAKKQLKKEKNLRLFQIGKVYDSEEEHLALIITGRADKNLLFKGQKYDGKLLRYYLGFLQEKLEEKYIGKKNNIYFYEGKILKEPTKQQKQAKKQADLSFVSDEPLIWAEVAKKTPCKLVLFDYYNPGEKHSYSATIFYDDPKELENFTQEIENLGCKIR